MDTQLSVEASVGIGLGIGTLCGLVTMLVRSVGLFMVGLLLGLLVGVASLVVRRQLKLYILLSRIQHIKVTNICNRLLKINDKTTHVML